MLQNIEPVEPRISPQEANSSQMAKLEGEGLTTVGHKFGEMVGGEADRDPVPQPPTLFDTEYKTKGQNEGGNTGKEASAQNNTTPSEGKCCPDHNVIHVNDLTKHFVKICKMAKMGDDGILSTIGRKAQELVGGGADRDPAQGQAPPSFETEYRTNEGKQTGKEACVAAQNNPTPFEGKCCPEHGVRH
ncbi:unnamed protein product [Cylicocyclus nassatus]|uniref:Uncharacterized protein n=1 Tax=Cylicocyclus nassatus TaxID=53992 RepID=A0AA36ME80_CYLNA|nr:unnamed protein product [Cylicocyclus nassatus]